MNFKKIELLPYQPRWKEDYEDEVNRLKETLPETLFYHIGSTSIAGCEAKPIIDILGVTDDVRKLPLQINGYESLGEYGMKNRRLFRKREGVAVNLHIFEETDSEVERHLRFRDYMQNHPQDVLEYSKIKKKGALAHPEDINRYIEAKAPFIRSIDQKAAWAIHRFIHPRRDRPREVRDIVEALDLNFYLQLTHFTKCTTLYENTPFQDLVVVRSERPSSETNFVFSARFTEENLLPCIEETIGLFRHSFSWYVSPLDKPPDLSKALIEKGFVSREPNRGMYKELHLLKESHFTLKFTIANDLNDFIEILHSIDENALIFENLPPILFAKGGSLEIAIGYLDDRPVTTGMLVYHGGVAGIYYLITKPEHQKKGYATQMMEFLQRRAQERGYKIVVLQSVSKAYTLYKKLGFQKCCLIQEFFFTSN